MHLAPPPPAKPVIVPSQSSRVLRALGDEMHFHLTGKDTADQYTMATLITPPGGGPPPHVHENEDEWFHVLEGTVGFFTEGKWTELGPGGSAYLPRGVAHTFKNVGDKPSTMMVQTAPAGFEHFFSDLAEVCAAPEGPDMEKVVQVAGRHGISFVME